jgi:hypothetical protein
MGNMETAKLAMETLSPGLMVDAVVLDEDAYTNAATSMQQSNTSQALANGD